ncbi:hypothetical protein CC1G_10141 [Coprinopsis cinerea okayama7|uniref:CxC2-like cysteine cluster KDZ transposase-associated domain-containing protein n=1 Tax=Coprinopsis cinerea (strain Okayama-7 / 130 / ATCC MYA-4618 / FGSC 9003) TaxID=240176 RepID=A8PEC7_COPC7|nr:hypothetical protein CC1G_10141 [Coprinopsis cinerea okayama7\|eukprot:XP_001840767.1 hypothetical protein CC1G_10141 [Coprinopsis cinerea okayama7\
MVPKFHLPAHIQSCRENFSLNFTPGAAITDGEGNERTFDYANRFAGSTREMRPGARIKLLNDVCNDWNWKKTTKYGTSLLKRLTKAIPGCIEHSIQLHEMESVVKERGLEVWKQEMIAWEDDASKPNPFTPKTKGITEKDARLALAKEAESPDESAESLHPSMHPSVMVAVGLQLEDEQRKHVEDANDLGAHATSSQLASVLESSNRLRARIATWTEIQALYMLFVVLLREKATTATPNGTPSTKVEDIPLWLPSAVIRLTPRHHPHLKLAEYEWKLREGQASDALHQIRHHLRLSSFLYKNKRQHSRGVRANTRANAAQEKVQVRIKRETAKYRAARNVMLDLAKVYKQARAGWEVEFRELREGDVRNLSEADVGQSEGKRTVSWIWISEGIKADGDGPHLNDALRFEWARTYARAKRHEKEVELVQEEMRRVLQGLLWQANDWKTRGGKLDHIGSDPTLMEGMLTYRERQAQQRLELRERFQNQWAGVSEKVAAMRRGIDLKKKAIDEKENGDE